ncbi:MAG: FAD-binding molybdopterin dehydrogenase [Rhodospirillales bacterium]|nr:FAD-binding molybdopterin dehydrogenase [Rhodospirillales bacterium]
MEPVYHAPGTLDEVLALLAIGRGEARILAGGQTLVPLLFRVEDEPHTLIDLRRIVPLRAIDATATQVALGAMVTLQAAELALRTSLPQVAAALRCVGTAPIRARATVGGTAALADPWAELVTCLHALDAELVLVAEGRERRVRAIDFFHGIRRTARQPDELLRQVVLPLPVPGERHAYHEFTVRESGGKARALAFARRRDGRTTLTLAGERLMPLRVDGTISAAQAALRHEDPSARALLLRVAGQALAMLDEETDPCA